jgi:LPS export ABC transporter protein LptC
MRSRLRLLIGAVLATVLVAGGWLLARDARARRDADRSKITLDVMPDVAQRIQNFHRLKVENGRKVWEISAREAQYREGEGTVSVREPLVALFLEDGREVSLRGTHGTVFLQGRELDRVEVEGEIAVRFDKYTMSTDHAAYVAERGVVVAPGTVRIQGDGLDIHGTRMEVNVAAQRLTLAEHVQVTLWPKAS